MRNKLGFLAFPLALGGCSMFDNEHVIPVAREAPVFQEPVPVVQETYEWTVITRENVDAVMNQLELQGGEVVLFAITPEGYGNININAAEMRRYIAQQASIIEAYEAYVAAPVER